MDLLLYSLFSSYFRKWSDLLLMNFLKHLKLSVFFFVSFIFIQYKYSGSSFFLLSIHRILTYTLTFFFSTLTIDLCLFFFVRSHKWPMFIFVIINFEIFFSNPWWYVVFTAWRAKRELDLCSFFLLTFTFWFFFTDRIQIINGNFNLLHNIIIIKALNFFFEIVHFLSCRQTCASAFFLSFFFFRNSHSSKMWFVFRFILMTTTTIYKFLTFYFSFFFVVVSLYEHWSNHRSSLSHTNDNVPLFVCVCVNDSNFQPNLSMFVLYWISLGNTISNGQIYTFFSSPFLIYLITNFFSLFSNTDVVKLKKMMKY